VTLTLPRAPGVLRAPLDPSPDEGRSWLRRELLHPDYQQDDLLQRLLDWVERVIGDGVEAAGRTPSLSLFAAMLVLLLLVLGVAWLLSRTDRAGGRRRPSHSPLVDPRLSAATLRERAEAAFAAEQYGEALVDAFRATATRHLERGDLDDVPGLTAHEVAEAMAATHPSHAAGITEVARDFDLVLYGDRPVTREQASAARALDDELGRRRVVAR